jgi:hypothetical protein
VRRFSLALVRLAARLLPAKRAAWASAMIAELPHCDDEGAAVVWAVGCVVAALKERVSAMFKSSLRISTWVAVPEMLLCFVPLTIAFCDAVQALSSALHRPMSGDSNDAAVPLVAAALAAMGPIGLVVAFRTLFNAKRISARWLRTALMAAPVLNGIVLIAQGLSERVAGTFQAFDFWSGLVLLSALPALGAAHLMMVPEVGVEPTRL